MCLSVTTVPASKKDYLVYPCFKSLDPCEKRYTTYFQNTPIPLTGWLVPKKPLMGLSYYHPEFPPDSYYTEDVPYGTPLCHGDDIHGGVIHAYLQDTQDNYWRITLPAYAINVIAFEKTWMSEELCCGALYIPGMDHTKKAKRTTEQLQKWSEYQPTMEEIEQFVPKKVRPFLVR